MNKQQITQLASNCFFVKGARKNLIIDLQNNEWYHVDFDVTKEKSFSNHQISKEDLDYMLKRQILIQIPKKIKKNFKACFLNAFAQYHMLTNFYTSLCNAGIC